MIFNHKRTITAAEIFSESCQYTKVKINGRPYWRNHIGSWVYDDQARAGEYDNAPIVIDPENVGSLF